MSLFFQDSTGGGSAIDTIQTISSATSTTTTAWSSTVQAAFTAPGQTLSAAAISAADVGKTTTIVNTGANAFTLAQTGGSITSAIGLTVSPGATCALKAVSTTTSIVVGTNSSQNSIGEFGSLSFATSGQQTLTTTVADLNQSTFTLPTAGTWEVTYTAHTFSVSNANITVYIADTLNNIVANSIGQSNESSASQSFIPITKTVYITTTGSTVYKLRGISSVATTGGVLPNDAALRSNTISWNKISGFTPVTGQSVDYLFYKPSATTVAGGSTADITSAGALSGNIPFVPATGLFTLTAGKTYELEASVYSNAIVNSASAYFTISFTDSANATLPNTGAASATNLGQTATYNETGGTLLKVIYTPTVNQQVKLRLVAANTPVTPYPNGSYVKITQLGSSAAFITTAVKDQTTSGYFDVGTMRMQWGLFTTTASSFAILTFPAPFANNTYSFMGSGNNNAARILSVNTKATTTVNVSLQDNPTGAAFAGQLNWFAIGLKP